MFKRIDKEVLFGGIFGIVAIIAAIGEMIANGISVAGILGAAKDVAGTVVAVMVFIIAVKHLFVRKATDFNGVFELEMEKVIEKYSPIIAKDDNVFGRYNIASNLDSILGNETGSYHTLFDTDRKSVTFHVTKTVFMGKSKDSFDDKQKAISSRIAAKLEKSYDIIDKAEIMPKGVKVTFKNELQTNDDAIAFAEIIDCVILLFFVEYKKENHA